MFAANRRVASQPIILKPFDNFAVVVRSRHSGCYRQNRSRPALESWSVELLSFRLPLQSSRCIAVLLRATEKSFRFFVVAGCSRSHTWLTGCVRSLLRTDRWRRASVAGGRDTSGHGRTKLFSKKFSPHAAAAIFADPRGSLSPVFTVFRGS